MGYSRRTRVAAIAVFAAVGLSVQVPLSRADDPDGVYGTVEAVDPLAAPDWAPPLEALEVA